MMNLFEWSEDVEFVLVVVWGVVIGGLVLNLLSCWLCCCCRSFDGLRRVLAGLTAFTVIIALVVTAVYTQDLSGLWLPHAPRRHLFNDTERAARVLKKIKWPS